MQYSTKQGGLLSQTGTDDPIYNYLKNVLGGKVTKERYIAFNFIGGKVPDGYEDDEIIPEDVVPLLEK